VILDFGMAVEIEPAVKKELLRLVRAVARGDTDGVVDGFYRLRLVEPGINPALLGDAARTLMNISIGTDLSPRRIQEICEDIYTTFHRFPLRLPQSLVYLLRASALVEGIGMAFDPNFNGLRAGRPVVKRMLSGVALEPEQPILDRLVGEVRRILRAAEDFLQILHETRRGQLQIRLHPADLEHLDRAYNAIVRRMMLGMGAVALALLGAFVHLRSGLWAFPIGCGATAALTWLYCLVFPLGKPPIPRGPSE
jgi:predicted unusual protein kinase regulating ubiquinone biosynthesis (AarF/ABC1/UbiB family)